MIKSRKKIMKCKREWKSKEKEKGGRLIKKNAKTGRRRRRRRDEKLS